MNKKHVSVGTSALATLFGIATLIIFPLTTAFAATTCDPAVELVSNGSFETPLVTHPDKWGIFASGSADGWLASWLPTDATTLGAETQPSVAYLEFQSSGHNTWGIPFAGNQYAELDTDWKGPTFPSKPYPASIDMYQTITTIPGVTYTLSFATSPRPDDADLSDNSGIISWNNAVIDTITATSVNPTHTTWTNHSYSVLATASSTRVDFVDGGHPNALGLFVDAVSLKCASAPAGGGGGGGGFGAYVASTSTITVIIQVVNANGGTSTSSNFVITATGNGISTTTATTTGNIVSFPGSPLGTKLVLTAGAYAIDELTPGAYTKTLSADCSGTIVAGANKICTITNTDPVPAPAGGGGGGGGTPPVIVSGGGGTGPTIVSGGGGTISTPSGTGSTSGSGGTAGTTTPPIIGGQGGGGGVLPPQGQVLGTSTENIPGLPYTGHGTGTINIAAMFVAAALAIGAFTALRNRFV